MDDKTRAKELAKAHRAVQEELYNPLLEDAERSKLRDRRDRLGMKKAEHQRVTGWAYDVPDYPGEPGRWKHSIVGFLGRRTEWIYDKKETGQ